MTQTLGAVVPTGSAERGANDGGRDGLGRHGQRSRSPRQDARGRYQGEPIHSRHAVGQSGKTDIPADIQTDG